MEISYDNVDIPYDLILLVGTYLKIPLLDKIKKIYYETDDKPDIFKELKNGNISDADIGDNYICYSINGEYGHTIQLCELDGYCIYEILVDNTRDKNGINYITTFYNHTRALGLYERIYSNRIDYTLNGEFYPHNMDEKLLMDIYNINTKMIMHDKKYPKLYEYITSILKSGMNDITLIPEEELEEGFMEEEYYKYEEQQ